MLLDGNRFSSFLIGQEWEINADSYWFRVLQE